MKKRLFSLLLAVVMVLSLFPALSQTAEAATEYYNLWVGGVRVSSANSSDILGDGTAQFDPDTNMLWLDNANITTPYIYDTSNNISAFVYANGIDLTIRGSAAITGAANYGIYVPNGTLTVNADLNITVTSAGNGYAIVAMSCYKDISILGGTMNLTAASSAIYSPSGNVTISGGSLTLKGGGIYSAIEAGGAISITDGVEYVDATASYGAICSATNSISIGTGLAVTEPENPVYGNFVYQSDGTTKAKHVVITCVQAYDLWVGGVQVDTANQNDILGDGTASFDPATTTLTLDNPTLNGSHGDKSNRDAAIYSELTADLTLEGRGTIGNSKYTYGVYAQSDAEGNGGGLILNGDFNIIEGKYDSVLARGDLTVLGGNLVTGSIYGGENASIYLLGGSIVASGTIIAGYHDINIGPDVRYVEISTSSTGFSVLTAKGAIHIDESLMITDPNIPLIKSDGDYTRLYSVSSTGGYSKATRVVITRAYDLWVGGVQVTGANLDDILKDGGKAKYNPDTQELTLNNPNLTGAYPSEGSNAVIYSKMADVILKGKATIDAAGHTWGVYAGATSGGYDGELVLNGDFTVTGATAYDLLSYGDFTVQGGNLTCGSMRGYNQNVRIIGGSVTASTGIQADDNIYITNGARMVDAAGMYSALYAYGKTISLGDELIILEPDPAVVKDGKIYESDGVTAARHVVIANPSAFPLTITQQPENCYGAEGETAVFTVAASGLNVIYMWQYSSDGGNYWNDASNNTDTLTVEIGEDNNGFLYRCVVADSFYQMVISDEVWLQMQIKPVITAQPKAATVKAGNTAKFTVAAEGEALSYLWQYSADNGATWHNSTAASANSPTLSFTAKTAYHGRLYRCIVKNDLEYETISDAVKLTVTPKITTQPKAVSAAVGDTAKFTVAAEGTGLTYQWQYKTASGTTWSAATATGAKTATISVPATAGRNAYQYRCVVTDKNGKTATSSAAKLTILTTITTQPKSVSSETGKTVKFTVEATGAGLTYQWQLKTPTGSWQNCTASSGKTATLSVSATAGRNGYQYRCKITDANGKTVTSSAAKLTILTVITTQPKAASAAIGAKASFTVAASGAGLTYQWQYKTPSGTAWKDSTASGAKSAKLSVTATESRNGYLYRCVITDANGKTVTSSAAKLTIKITIITQPKNVTAAAGNKAKFTVEATGAGLTYQWQYQTAPGAEWKNSTASGAKTAAVSVTATASRNGYLYRCVITDANGKTATTNAVTLTVK